MGPAEDSGPKFQTLNQNVEPKGSKVNFEKSLVRRKTGDPKASGKRFWSPGRKGFGRKSVRWAPSLQWTEKRCNSIKEGLIGLGFHM